MEHPGGSGFTIKKQRSSRKPRSNIKFLSDGRDLPFHSSPLSSDKYGSRLSSYQNLSHDSSLSRRKLKNNEGNGNLGSNGLVENKSKKMTLKFRIGSNSNSDNQSSVSKIKPSVSSDASKHGHKLTLLDNVDDECPPKARGNNGLQGVSWKEFNGAKEFQSKLTDSVRKSNRGSKKRALDEEEDDDEIRYLQKLKSSKLVTDCDSRSSKSLKIKYDIDEDYNSSSRKKSKRVDKEVNDSNYVEEENIGCLTTRQRALQSNGGSFIEFPDGLPPAPSRKQKLSEEEKLAKKTEAAQRRKMQVEKADKESQAEVIRKIRGQDSSRKKKEDKLRKERDDLAQKKAAESILLASKTIRCVMGPTRTVVTFGEAVGLPSIFDTKTASYPPPREKCAGPSCTNPYKYRDSKLNLPLCSLQCYRAVQERSEAISSC